MPPVKHILIGFLAAAGALSAAHAHAQAQATTSVTLAQIDQSLTCPEALPTLQAKRHALRSFLKRLETAQPTITIKEALEYRVAMLRKHHCVQTLANLGIKPVSTPRRSSSHSAATIQAPTGVSRSIAFYGKQYILYKTGSIRNGSAAYYSIDPRHPGSATDSIAIDRLSLQGAQGHREGAAQYQQAMLNHVRARGGTVIAPFKVPDKAHPGRYMYYASFYYIYPHLGLGDIWLSRVFLSGTGVVSMLYRHTIKGTDPSTIETDVRQWMAMNLTSYGPALGSLALPAVPTRLPGKSP